MDMLSKLSRDAQIVLAGCVLYVIVSFLDWQQVSFLNVHAGISEWHGVGVVAGLLALALLVWEAARLFGARTELGPVTPGLGSVGLALLLLLFTVVTFLTHGTARHWPAWVGLLLAIAIAAFAVRRARAEGVEMPDLNAIKSEMSARSKPGETAPAVGEPSADSDTEPPPAAPQPGS